MGKALYRKHRPRKLSEVVGQDHITTTLQNAIKNSAFSHAYLFTGPRGVGKTTIARILAHEINGISYDNDDLKLDIIEIDAASNNRIDEIREIRDKLHIAPSELKFKIYIIDEVHMLTKQAFNALLKTLEEPPEHVIFILATTESHKIPDTIISRTQRFSFKPIEHSDTISHLRTIADIEKINIEDSALKLLADHGRGSFRDSISMMDQISGIDSENISATQVAELLGVPDNKIIAGILKTVENQDTLKIFTLTQQLKEKGINPSTVAKQLILYIRDQLANKTNAVGFKSLVELMKELLPITGNYGSYEALEITLLNAIAEPGNDNSIKSHKNIELSTKKEEILDIALENTATYGNKSNNESQDYSENVKKTELKSEVAMQDVEKYEIQSDSKTSKNNSSAGNWSAVIDVVKKNHNTLYGILRMAKVKEEDNMIQLTFKFEFHKKQIEQAKNLNKLQIIVDGTYKKPTKISLNFSKTTKVEPVLKTETQKENNDLKSVSNIFGGAELLES